MNDAIFAAYSAYLADLAAVLRVGDWGVHLTRDPLDGADYAQVGISRVKDDATVTLGRDFFARPPEDQRTTLVHEILHLQTTRVCRAMTQLAEQLDDIDVVLYANKRLDEEEEILVDRLARVLSPLLPLPPIVEKEAV